MDGCKRRWEEVMLGKAAAQGKDVSIPALQVFDKMSQQGNSTNVVQIEQLSNGSEEQPKSIYRPVELLKTLKKSDLVGVQQETTSVCKGVLQNSYNTLQGVESSSQTVKERLE
ncbi:hypothetical protein LIER_34513 [Lithospermum erythrorhizon]|uniref:Uncharacterized protein n=1 Tax=Lithospermum erythrorhizon TaxID=34254 RepID=A0AAV3S229_LITER